MQQKILLVDDREDNLLSLETILEQDGYSFKKARSGREALKVLLAEFDFALILMDIMMPSLNGFETAALIYEREKLRHIPIIFITANSYGEENIFKGYMAGAVDYIYKPVNPGLLRAKVSIFIDLYRKNHQLLAQEQKLKTINKNLENEIQERKNSEERVQELNRQLLTNVDRLESANKELDRFAFMASHDLQEPLRKIRTFSDLLCLKCKNDLDNEAQIYINRIQKAAERMQELIKDLMTFSKISSEKKRFVKTDLNKLIQEVIGELESKIHDKKARIEVGKLPFLHINPILIRPLFYNLIENALKYSKKDLIPVINIYSDNNSPDQDALLNIREQKKYSRIFIQDNGIGFEQKYAEQIFDMFKRLHSHVQYEGTGIGLALCKQIIEKHNGYISAISKIDEGTLFIIALPTEQEEIIITPS